MTGVRHIRAADERGFILLVVLWAMVLLAIIGTEITLTGRSETQLAWNIRDHAVAEAQADGLVYESIFRLLDQGSAHWRADQVVHTVRVPQGVAQIRIEDLDGLIGLNVAPASLLQALLQRLGVDPRRAEALAAAIADWRSTNLMPTQHGAEVTEYRAAGLPYGPPDAPFRSDDELAFVLGMTPDLLVRLKPNVTVFQEVDPVLALAPPAVAEALADLNGFQDIPAMPANSMSQPSIVRIIVSVIATGGVQFERRAVVRLSPDAVGTDRSAYRILAWGSGGA